MALRPRGPAARSSLNAELLAPREREALAALAPPPRSEAVASYEVGTRVVLARGHGAAGQRGVVRQNFGGSSYEIELDSRRIINSGWGFVVSEEDFPVGDTSEYELAVRTDGHIEIAVRQVGAASVRVRRPPASRPRERVCSSE